MAPERRGLNYGREDDAIALRMDTSGEAPKIRGYVAVYNRFSPTYGNMRERIAPGFFDAALKESPDVRLLFNHDPNFLLGRTTSGTLKLESDSIGLKIEATPPASGTLRDMVIAPMERGDLTGASFSFTLQP
ncbi:MAG TPA: HK97 family phage prohead protease, partial [Candidatus Saccharimonadales bacterium]|nr:HK97 family phage prohead protease [Candidatus Saccharimonadales bacterium]